MYTKFFSLKEKPFEITPDPKFLYLSDHHREALAHLLYAVRERKGFTVITGEAGTGKTTLIQTLLSTLNGKTRTAYLFNPKLNSTDFLRYICNDLGLKGLYGSKGQNLIILHNFLLNCYSLNQNVVLIVDEAQSLDPKLLEEIRLLTNLETPKSKLLQVILMGQPELNNVLDHPLYRQLKQRVSLRYHIYPLNKEETKKYILKRLIKAGAADPNIFTAGALDEIYRYSKGIPRLINIVCDNALLTGYATEQKMVKGGMVREAIRHLDGSSLHTERRRSFLFRGILLGLIALGILAFFFSLLNWRGEFIEGLSILRRMMESLYQAIWNQFFTLAFKKC
jgi:general secretion pathway protein A